MKSKYIYLSYMIDENTPTYGNRSRVEIIKKSSIKNGDVANDSAINSTLHLGTHLDMPYHFYENGETIKDFSCEYFNFENVLFLEITPKSFLIKDEIMNELENIKNKEIYELLIVKTGICNKRDSKEFWEKNYGFAPEVADYLRKYFPKIRVFGFDSISVSSFQNRMVGREAHKSFLNPKNPILLLEDMNLKEINENIVIKKVIIAPFRIAKCDGIPCTIIAEVEEKENY